MTTEAVEATVVETPTTNMFGGIMQERGIPSFAASEKPAETPIEEKPVVEETPVVETPVIEAEPEEPVYKASVLKEKLGEDNIDLLSERLQKLSAAEQRAQDLAKKEEEYEKFKGFVKNPYGNDKFKEADTFFRRTGISDANVAMKFSGRQASEIATASPIDALALKEYVNNPNITMSFNEVREAVSESLGLDPDVKITDLTQGQRLALDKAVHEIHTAFTKEVDGLNVWEKFESDLSTQRLEREKTEAAAKEAISTWQGKTAVKLEKVDYAIKDGDKTTKIDIPVSEQTRVQVQREVEAFLQNNPSIYSEESNKRVQDYVRNRIFELEYPNALEIAYKHGVATQSGIAKEEAVKEYHNPAPVIKQEKPDVLVQDNPAEAVGSVLKQSLKNMGSLR
jgi:hypothetical protein